LKLLWINAQGLT